MANLNPPTQRSIYLLPNLLTTSALFSAFFAIVASINHRFAAAVVAIYLAMLMDALDGRIARLIGAQSDFGAQYDSLSDMVAFAVAPALMAYNFGLHQLGRIGWIASFFYVVCTALRLARFNVQIKKVDMRYFRGLPCPVAAGVLVGAVWIDQYRYLSITVFNLILLFLMVFLGLLMVSNFLYYSFKSIDFKGKVPFVTILSMVCGLILITIKPLAILPVIFSAYTLSGPLLAVWRYFKRSRASSFRVKKILK